MVPLGVRVVVVAELRQRYAAVVRERLGRGITVAAARDRTATRPENALVVVVEAPGL
jgi:hypothetical protein